MNIIAIISLIFLIIGLYCSHMASVNRLKMIGARENGEMELHELFRKRVKKYRTATLTSIFLIVLIAVLWGLSRWSVTT